MRPGLKHASSWIVVRFVSAEQQWEPPDPVGLDEKSKCIIGLWDFSLFAGNGEIMKEALKTHPNPFITVYPCPGSKTLEGKRKKTFPFSNFLFAFSGLHLPETKSK